MPVVDFLVQKVGTFYVSMTYCQNPLLKRRTIFKMYLDLLFMDMPKISFSYFLTIFSASFLSPNPLPAPGHSLEVGRPSVEGFISQELS